MFPLSLGILRDMLGLQSSLTLPPTFHVASNASLLISWLPLCDSRKRPSCIYARPNILLLTINSYYSLSSHLASSSPLPCPTPLNRVHMVSIALQSSSNCVISDLISVSLTLCSSETLNFQILQLILIAFIKCSELTTVGKGRVGTYVQRLCHLALSINPLLGEERSPLLSQLTIAFFSPYALFLTLSFQLIFKESLPTSYLCLITACRAQSGIASSVWFHQLLWLLYPAGVWRISSCSFTIKPVFLCFFRSSYFLLASTVL